MAEKFEPSFMIKPDRLFAVNQTNFDRINVYGFDYDYTLAEYSKEMEEFIYHKAVEILHQKYKYPKSLLDQPYIPDFCIRGLHFDVKLGLIMKIDERHIVQLDTVYRGHKHLGRETALQELGYDHIPKSLMDESCFRGNSSLQQLTDIFALPEMLLLVNVMEFFTNKEINYDPFNVYDDVQRAVREVHTEKHLHHEVRSNTDKYLVKDCLQPLINKLLRDKKSLFLLTNSKFSTVRLGMEHMLGKDWQDAFDVVVVEAKKPNFFDIQDRPFKTLLFESTAHNNGAHLSWDKIEELQKGEIYCGGCCNELMRLQKWKSGEVIYFGDQIYADLQTARHSNGWYTCAVIQELKREIDIMNGSAFTHNVVWIQTLERLIERMQDYGDEESRGVVAKWMLDRQNIQRQLKSIFNPRFGSVFRSALQGSYFSARLCRVADVYTSSVMNLLNYQADKILFPPRGSHPHEQLVSTGYQHDGFDTALLAMLNRIKLMEDFRSRP